MRIMTLALAGLLAVFVTDSQAFPAKRSSGAANPDRRYYQGAARGCGGGAYCYRSGNHSKKHRATVLRCRTPFAPLRRASF
jgi:hypothetical protein